MVTQNLNYLHCMWILSLPQTQRSIPSLHVPPCLQQDDEINQQSQLIEKLKQQMLDQEEVMGRRDDMRGEGVVFVPRRHNKDLSDGRRGILLGFSHPKTVEVWRLNQGFA